MKGQDNMKIIPRLAVAGFAVLAAYAPLASTAGATEATPDCVQPYCNPTVNTDKGAVLGNEEAKPVVAPAAAEQPAVAEAPKGELAFTGGDVLGMSVIGAGALGVGTILVRRSKAAKRSA